MPNGRQLRLSDEDARRIAEHIVLEGLLDEWEARVAAYNDAVAGFYEWLQGLPPFPRRMAGDWNFLLGSMAVAEELVRMARARR